VKSPAVVLVLVLDFSGIFENENENENEDDGAVGGFSHSFGRRRARLHEWIQPNAAF